MVFAHRITKQSHLVEIGVNKTLKNFWENITESCGTDTNNTFKVLFSEFHWQKIVVFVAERDRSKGI